MNTFQQALSAVWVNRGRQATRAMSVYREVLSASRGDADTVACIAGGLVGALGTDPATLPGDELAKIHGEWPCRLGVADLVPMEAQLLARPAA